jgi:MFS transporter, DHA3 family, macrolide efflux protein
MGESNTAQGMRVFLTIWLGQLISLIGSGLTNFALGVWVYQRTGSVTLYAFILLFATLPGILISPVAGVLIDRSDRRLAMIFSDLAAGASTICVALLLFTNSLEIWHIYITVSVNSIAGAFRLPSFMALVSLTVPMQQFGRASGMMQMAQAASQVIAPLLAAVLVPLINIQGVVMIDFVSFLFAVTTLLFIRVPTPEAMRAGKKAKASIWKEAAFGWQYIATRPGLLGLLGFFAMINITYGFAQALFTPLVLSFADSKVLGTVLSVGATGFLTGSIVMSVWGGPRRRIYGVLGFSLLYGVSLIAAGIRPSATVITVALFGIVFGIPIISGCSQAIWQSKTAPEVQGRVFAMRTMLAWSCAPLAFLLSGPLADKVFEPMLAANGILAGSVGRLIGTGPGRGIGFIFIVIGVMALMIPVYGYFNRRLWLVEDELPDILPNRVAATA